MLYLHIGFRKTGTTTIQNFLRLNRELLKEQGVIYPDLGGNGAHFALAKQFSNRKAAADIKTGMWNELKSSISANPGKNFVVSAENFHNLPTDQLKKIGEEVQGVAVKILVYIREISEFIPSRYAQRVKTGGEARTFDRFFASSMADDAEEDSRYFRDISRWADVFGWESVRVRSLDEASLCGGNLLHDFVAAIGLDFAAIKPRLAAASFGARNIAPGWKAIELLRGLHAASGAIGENRKERLAGNGAHLKGIATALHSLSVEVAEEQGLNADRGRYLTRDQWERCNAHYDAELRMLNEKLIGFQLPFPIRSAQDDRSFMPEASQIPVEERAAFYEALVFRFAADMVKLMRRTAKSAKLEGKSATKVSREARSKRGRKAARDGAGGTGRGRKKRTSDVADVPG